MSRDLWREIENRYGVDASVCYPKRRGVVSLVGFACRSLIAGLRAGKSTHIHLGDASLCPLGVLIVAVTGAKVSVTVAGLDVIYNAWWYQPLLRWSIRRMNTVCAISQAAADAAEKRGVPKSRIVIIPCGIDTQNLPLRPSPSPNPNPNIVLLSIGRLISRKGIAWFTDQVMPLLLETYPTLQYRIVGDGPERSVIEDSIDRRGLAAHVTLLGSCDDEERDAEILGADLLIVPNISVPGDIEGFGIVCIEASARGLPVAAANREGVRDAVQERETGRFFESGNAADATRVIGEMLRTPFDPLEVEQATAIHYDWARLFPLYENVFQ